MMKVLFQGDSITDAWRSLIKSSWDREVLGTGYANMIAAHLSYEEPKKYDFINRGINGHRVIDLSARWEDDCINIKPDVLSILIGVNDLLHEIKTQGFVDVNNFEAGYSLLIKQTKKELPNIKIILLEPFITRGTVTDEYEQIIFSEIKKIQEAVSRIAEKHNLPLVKLQEKFDHFVNVADAARITTDGVHPTYIGHELIKRAWLEIFENII